jgi:deoxyadenosine/deoxycytidine kinase
MSTSKNISVIGNIGCGKSTLLHSLYDQEYDVAFEPVNDWKFLNKFYTDMKRWCFALQVEILNSFKVMDISNKIVERSPWEACNIFAKNSHLNNLMTDDEYHLICQITKSVGYKPDVFIYLRSTPELCMERIKKRNRHCESKVTAEYITQLHVLYDQCIEDLIKEGKHVFIVDAYKEKQSICEEVIEFLTCSSKK